MPKYRVSATDVEWIERDISGNRFKTLGYHENLAMVICQTNAGWEVGFHHHPNEECAYYLKGSSQITIGEETFVARAGDYVFIPPNVPHKVKVFEDTEFIAASSPPKPVYKPTEK